MIKHVVFFKFNPGTPDEEKSKMENGLRNLPSHIPEIKNFELGKNVVHSERSFDFALIGTFDDLESLKKYAAHPEHQKVLKLINRICGSIKSVDFET